MVIRGQRSAHSFSSEVWCLCPFSKGSIWGCETVFCLCLSDECGAPAVLFQVRWPTGQDELGSRGQPDPGSQAGSRGSHPAEGLHLRERGVTFVDNMKQLQASDLVFMLWTLQCLFCFPERAGLFHQWRSLSQPVWVAVALGSFTLKINIKNTLASTYVWKCAVNPSTITKVLFGCKI